MLSLNFYEDGKRVSHKNNHYHLSWQNILVKELDIFVDFFKLTTKNINVHISELIDLQNTEKE